MTELKIQKEVPLKEYTTFRIGGSSKYFTSAYTVEEIVEAICYCKKASIPYMVIGKGSNSLFDDRGFNGMVILNKINFINSDTQGFFSVGAGYSFSLLGVQTARKGWSGLEFASGIPGSVGGAVFMNAGANESETRDFLHSVDYVDEKGIIHTFKSEEIEFNYRFSQFQKMKGAIVGASFQLSPNSAARKKQIEIVNYRSKTQPYNAQSVGCIFRNPSFSHAGKLIESSGLKGYQIGGAKVSEVHANFIVNTGNATAEDVKQLIFHIQKTLKDHYNIELENEVHYIPFKGKNDE